MHVDPANPPPGYDYRTVGGLKNLVADRMVDGKTTKGLMLDDIRRELRNTFEGQVRKAMRLGHPAGKVPESAWADSHKKMVGDTVVTPWNLGCEALCYPYHL